VADEPLEQEVEIDPDWYIRAAIHQSRSGEEAL
jgi:hypothetical protein